MDKSEDSINLSAYIIFTFYGFLMLIFGFFVNTPKEVLQGIYRIVIEPDFLITDYIHVGGLGAAFVNAGLVTVISILILYRFHIRMTGASISTLWIMAGFSLFGKNIFNIWFIMAGVFAYAWYQGDKINKYIYVALLGTSLSPLITQIMFGMDKPYLLSIPLGIGIGLFTGFIIPPLSAYLMKVHQGFNLYNIGFTSGLLGTIIISIFRSYGFESESRALWSTGNNTVLCVFLGLMFSSIIAIGFLMNRSSIKGLKNIYKYSGRLVSDFTILEGMPVTLMNMGINGIMAVVYVLLVGGDLNGPTIGGIFAIVGFSSFGKHTKNMLPIFLGVFLGALTKVWEINDPRIMLAALFGTTLAPISGEFGWKYGLIAGFLMSSVVINVGYLHGGFNLYNSGFAGGLVAAVMVPIIEAFRKGE